MNELRNRKKQKLKKLFLKKTEFLDQIKDKENNIEFLQSLLSDDKTLENILLTIKKS
jgi:hypothetical protein